MVNVFRLCSIINFSTVRWQGTWKLVHGCGESCRNLTFGSGRHDLPQPGTSFQVHCHLTVQLIMSIEKTTKQEQELHVSTILKNILIPVLKIFLN